MHQDDHALRRKEQVGSPRVLSEAWSLQSLLMLVAFRRGAFKRRQKLVIEWVRLTRGEINGVANQLARLACLLVPNPGPKDFSASFLHFAGSRFPESQIASESI